MPHDTQQYRSQQFEHIIATIFTCRSVVKYNLTLSPEQKNELLLDIDTSLEALRAQLIAPQQPEPEGTAGGAQPVEPDLFHLMETDALSSQHSQIEPQAEKQTLQSLYRMYRAYLGEEQVPNIYTFMKRFNELMTTMNELQRHMHAGPAGHGLQLQQESVERALERLQTFTSDLYSTFMEFIRMLSDLLQQNNVYLSTEELSSRAVPRFAQEPEGHSEQRPAQRDLTPLFKVYTAHQQVERLKGSMIGRGREANAFLNVLKQNVSNTINGRDELIMRLNQTTTLLDEMLQLLLEYEQASANLL